MKYLRVISSMDPASGGPCQGIRNSITELQKLGIDNQVICLDAPDALFLGKDPFPIIALGPAKTPWAYSPLLSQWLLQNLPQFEAVIIHGLWQYHGYAVQKALHHLRKNNSGTQTKLFVMPHGMLDPYFQRAQGRKLKALRNIAYWALIEQKVVHCADGLLFTCERELELARQPFRPYHPKKEINVGYGIVAPLAYQESMKTAFAKNCPALGDQPYLLFLSRIHEKKGVDLLIKAYAQILKKYPSSNISGLPKLVIAGPGMDTTYGKKIRQTVQENEGLEEQVYFPGMLHGEAKWGAFYGCEAFVLPSHQENFGIAVAEALACAKPVLISNQVNIYLEIASAGAGIVENDTEAGCLKMLETWLDLSDRGKEEMKVKAKQCFETHFSIGPNARRMMEAVGG
ncbi:glycosyltransferase [Cognataquiflexum rubidum]|uniref:glycosyltransferase n=1 Tax=Cognataquiflexum rubidum TaxID=2922273 RepID=UPI001F1436A9|nr:glycosyltransferase [Cognataquiflexum rubidum]MCH6234040.1 glycosyltransferase [Cognataquiflexum rubidum]